MAIETAKSALIAGRDGTLHTVSNVELAAGPVKNVFQTVTVAASASSTSRYVFFEVPSNARLKELKFMCTTTGSDTVLDFGIWRTTEDGGAVVDQDLFATAVAAASPIAESSYNNILSETGSGDFTTLDAPLWELAGLTSDPGYNYDVCAVVMSASSANLGGTLGLSCDYV